MKSIHITLKQKSTQNLTAIGQTTNKNGLIRQLDYEQNYPGIFFFRLTLFYNTPLILNSSKKQVLFLQVSILSVTLCRFYYNNACNFLKATFNKLEKKNETNLASNQIITILFIQLIDVEFNFSSIITKIYISTNISIRTLQTSSTMQKQESRTNATG